MTMELEERFWSKADWDVHTPGRCWPWLKATTTKGYGCFGFAGGVRLAHRVAYELEVGPIPEGMELDHTCVNPACVNPDHLEPVTHAENCRRQMARKTRCKNDHEFTDDNTYWYRGYRYCRACRYSNLKDWRAR